MPHQRWRENYTVGWICALPVELAAAQEMLDEEHEDIERDFHNHDENAYALGSIGGHQVVIVCLPAGRIGNNPAAAVATQMRATFPGIRFGLMVGIGGGVPSSENDIRLGDIVVSQPHGIFSGIVQYDMGKTTPSGFGRTGSLNSPPQLLLGAVARVRANEFRGKGQLSELCPKLAKFRRNKAGPDILFEATYDHEGGTTCDLCNPKRQLTRERRECEDEVVVHYGTIASGNQVMKTASQRDKVSAELGGVLCFEMEAAGLMNIFPCLVIRGICDYADSHKNKSWQAYAAGTAAAWAKQLLLTVPVLERANTNSRRPVGDCGNVLIQLPPQIWWQNPVVLNDARGRSFPFHLELVDSKELFVNILKLKFKDLGLGKVMRGEWYLQDHHSGRILDFNRPWGALVRPGQRIDMSMIFRKRTKSSLHCPSCHSENIGSPEMQTTCSACDLIYHRIEEIQDIGVEEEQPHQTPISVAHSAPRLLRKLPPTLILNPRPPIISRGNGDDEDDVSHYTRVRLIDTKFRVQKSTGSAVAFKATLRSQDLENLERLSEHLMTICGLSHEDCLAALRDSKARLLATSASNLTTSMTTQGGADNPSCVYCRVYYSSCDTKRPCTPCANRNIGYLCCDNTPKLSCPEGCQKITFAQSSDLRRHITHQHRCPYDHCHGVVFWGPKERRKHEESHPPRHWLSMWHL